MAALGRRCGPLGCDVGGHEFLFSEVKGRSGSQREQRQNVTYLSDLKPLAVQGTIAGDNFAINGELTGARMRVNGKLILNGIGSTVTPEGMVSVKYRWTGVTERSRRRLQ